MLYESYGKYFAIPVFSHSLRYLSSGALHFKEDITSTDTVYSARILRLFLQSVPFVQVFGERLAW